MLNIVHSSFLIQLIFDNEENVLTLFKCAYDLASYLRDSHVKVNIGERKCALTTFINM